MSSSLDSLAEIRGRMDEVKRFLSAALSIADAHTVEFYTHDVWRQFMAVTPEEVLSAVAAHHCRRGAPTPNANETSNSLFGFCKNTKRLVDIHQLLEAAKAHSIPGLGASMSRDELLRSLGLENTRVPPHGEHGAALESCEFMNSKKSHEVQAMSEVVACLARRCGVKQIIDVGSGKGYLCSFLSLKYDLQVYGIDSSSTNTHGAQERNRKLKKFSRAYQNQRMAGKNPNHLVEEEPAALASKTKEESTSNVDMEETAPTPTSPAAGDSKTEPEDSDPDDPFLGALPTDAFETPSPPRVPPGELSAEERERRKRENLERKARNRPDGADPSLFRPLTSYVTAGTELRELIDELQAAVMVGLHTCGDLAPSTLRMFVVKPELAAVCSVGCCYHLISEEFDPAAQERCSGVCGFPMSQHLRDQAWFCGRNARMSACLALERVSVGQGIQMESLFCRAVLHVILRDHYSSFKSERRVGNVYSKAKSFVDYVRRALRRLELDESKLSDSDIQRYHDLYRLRMSEMRAFNMLKVTLAPCIEGLILLDRLCYLKEQEDVAFSALVQLFDPLLSPRCYAVVGLKPPSEEPIQGSSTYMDKYL